MNAILAAVRRYRYGRRPFVYRAVPFAALGARGWHAHRATRREIGG